MTAARRREIRRIAHDQAARALDAAAGDWEVPQRLFDDPEEQAEFTHGIDAIVRQLRDRA
ncbi:hypothetical protein ABTX80_24905 [Streptomyces erythrochromogenes]|uniref:hypothetical protein n=1 Tax=Streptomyces erythrochromogenes TaxID=285574 RepID=UPI00331D72B4